MKTEDRQKKLSSAWLAAASALSVRVEAPYVLTSAEGTEVPCIAHLPDFGNAKGMVIGLFFRHNHEDEEAALKLAAKSRGLFCSFINPEVYENYNEEIYKEALTDWAFFGDEALRPGWMREPTKDK
jgi:hypothetical protein